MLLRALVQDVEQFELPITFSIVAHFTFGVTGALAGLRRGYDVIGVVFLALITAGGGGLIRDGLLISRGPPALLTDRYLMGTVLIAAILTLFFYRHAGRVGRVIAVIDALGLGAFAVHGVQRSLEAGLNIPSVVLGGTVTAVGGGLLRDILVREEPLLFKPGQFYALVAIGGSCLFLTLLHFEWQTPRICGLVTVGAVFLVRLLAIRFNWHTRSLYREPPPPAPPPV